MFAHRETRGVGGRVEQKANGQKPTVGVDGDKGTAGAAAGLQREFLGVRFVENEVAGSL